MKKIVTLAIASMFATASVVTAAPITGVTVSPGTASATSVVIPGGEAGGTGNPFLNSQIADLESGGPQTLTGNIIDIGITFDNLNTPTTFTFDVGSDFDFHTYRFDVTVTNNLNVPRAIDGLSIELIPSSAGATPNPAGFVFGPIATDPYNVAAPGDEFAGPFAGTGTSGYNFISETQLLLGAPAGGAGDLLPGDTDTVSFLVISPGQFTATSFDLVITATPEPTSLALGGVALLGLGTVVVRRRRSKKVSENQEEA